MSIRFEAVFKSFGDKIVLKDFSFEAATGEILFILGRSGMGKSVTLKQIVGLMKPDSGKIWVDDQEVTELDELELSAVRKKCGMVFQQPALLDSMNVEENIGFGLNTPPQQKHQRVLEVLDCVHLSKSLLKRMPSELSYGTQKRVSLARTLAPAPSYLLFDEPTTGLDPINTQAINLLIQDLSRRLQTTSIVVSHDMNCALAIADRILVLDQGIILEINTPNQMRKSKVPLIRDFFEQEPPQ